MKIEQYFIDEKLAKLAKEMNSFDNYIENSETQEYLTLLNNFENEINLLITDKISEEKEKSIEYYANKYSYKLANAINKLNSIKSRCPSILITGAGNFPVDKKLKQNQALDNFFKENSELFDIDNYYYKKIKNIINKVDLPKTDKAINSIPLENVTLYHNPIVGLTVLKNYEISRMQIIFKYKPNQEIRDVIKKHGFRWSPSNNAWQRQLTQNAIYATKRLLKYFLNEDIEM